MRPPPTSTPALLLALLVSAHSLRAATQERMEYQVSWLGTTVGTLSVESLEQADGTLLRSIRAKSSAWIALIYPVNTTIQCAIVPSPDGPRHTVSKRLREKDFVQNDTLTLWPDSGRSVWTEAITQTCTTSSLPKGTQDIVSFFFDIRQVFADGPMKTGGVYRLLMDRKALELEFQADALETIMTGGTYRVAMDGKAHELEFQADALETIPSRYGRLKAIPVRVISKSPTLFTRNRPRRVWIAVDHPAILAADVKTPLGTVRVSLTQWTRDGEHVAWAAPAKKEEDPRQD